VIAYVQGNIAYKCPTYVIIDCGGLGYQINISLYTYNKIEKAKHCKLFTYFHVKEDSHTLFGFADELERELFQKLISVKGVGPSTGRMVLSTLSPQELQSALVNEDVATIKRVKGVGQKSAQLIILELKDKVSKIGDISTVNLGSGNNTVRIEALSALTTLGYSRGDAEKAITKAIATGGASNAADVIKLALKNI